MRRLMATLFIFTTCALLLSSCATVPAGSAETGYSIHRNRRHLVGLLGIYGSEDRLVSRRQLCRTSAQCE